MIEIVSFRKTKQKSLYDISVARPSVLGNPFPMKSEADRNKVCDQYDLHFEKQRRTNHRFQQELALLQRTYERHGKLRLFCWCAPLRCHAETIKRWLERQL